MDDDKDSIALRMKRNDRRINQQSDGDVVMTMTTPATNTRL